MGSQPEIRRSHMRVETIPSWIYNATWPVWMPFTEAMLRRLQSAQDRRGHDIMPSGWRFRIRPYFLVRREVHRVRCGM